MTTNKDTAGGASSSAKSFVRTNSRPLVPIAFHPIAGAELPTALADQLLALEESSMQMYNLAWPLSDQSAFTNGDQLAENMTDQTQSPAYSLSHTSCQLQYVLGVEDLIQDSLVCCEE